MADPSTDSLVAWVDETQVGLADGEIVPQPPRTMTHRSAAASRPGRELPQRSSIGESGLTPDRFIWYREVSALARPVGTSAIGIFFELCLNLFHFPSLCDERLDAVLVDL